VIDISEKTFIVKGSSSLSLQSYSGVYQFRAPFTGILACYPIDIFLIFLLFPLFIEKEGLLLPLYIRIALRIPAFYWLQEAFKNIILILKLRQFQVVWIIGN